MPTMDRMINGFHTIIYSDDAAVTRAFFRDVLEWPWLDAHEGWLIFKAPPGELGVHPTAASHDDPSTPLPFHQASLMCDDLEATIRELRAKGVAVDDDIQEQGFGRTCSIAIPGAGWMMLYQPRHPLAHQLDG